jgi:hypothetical protein
MAAQGHYGVGSSFKRTLRGTLRAMVDAGRLEAVPHHASLFRLGGVVRQLSQEAGVQWPRSKAAAGALDSQVRGPLIPWFRGFIAAPLRLKSCAGEHPPS